MRIMVLDEDVVTELEGTSHCADYRLPTQKVLRDSRST